MSSRRRSMSSLASSGSRFSRFERAQCRSDRAQLGEDGLALGLGGMGGEHRHDAADRRRMRCIVGRVDAFGVEALHGLDQRLAHGHAGGLGLLGAVAQNLDALLVLGQVDQLEVGHEGLEHAQRAGQIVHQAEDQGLDLLARGGVARPPGLGEGANLLFQVVDLPSLLLDDRLAEQVAEEVDIGAECAVVCVIRSLTALQFRSRSATKSPITVVPTTSAPGSAMSPVRTPWP